MELREKIEEAVSAIARKDPGPEVGIILGTGLGSLSASIEEAESIPFSGIPHFGRTTGIGHKGTLIFGRIKGQSVVAMEGRLHLYEGHSLETITFPVRVMKALGVKILVVSNACGGLNPGYAQGDVMLIDDHINLMGVNPLTGPNDETLGPRFPDMCRPYDPGLIDLARTVAVREGIAVRQGVYAGLPGPCLETRAEYRYLRTIGADVVGMSTIPEVIVAVHAGLRVLGFSVITDMCIPETLEPVDIDKIIAVASEAEPTLSVLVRGVLCGLSKHGVQMGGEEQAGDVNWANQSDEEKPS